MKAVRFKNKKVSVTELPRPEVSENEALVRITMAGICTTDFAILQGYADFSGIPGHEFVGVVERCEKYPELAGKRVVADINCGCGKCRTCICEDARHCQDRQVIGIRGRNGAFAQYCAVPAENLHIVPDCVETISAVFSEPLAAALEITQQVHIDNKSRIAVLGDGKLGILSALVLKHYNRNVMLIGKHYEKLAVAGKQGVMTTRLMPDEENDSVRRRLGLFDMIVDATGNPGGIDMAVCLVRPRGKIIVKTTIPEEPRINLSAIVVNEINLIGSRCGDLSFALHFLEKKWIDVRPLVSSVYPLPRFKQAFSKAMEKESLKVLVAIEEDPVRD